MRNLRFLSVYKRRYDGNENDRVHIPEDLEFPPCLRLLQWEAYPSKSLPLTFHPEYLVELDMQKSQLEKLWEGTPPFANLKKIELMESCHLKELPDLSKATSLETLDLTWCQSLVEIPTSFSNLQKLKKLAMFACSKLEVIPTHMNMESLEFVDMAGCSRLKKFPDFSTNIITIKLSNTAVEEVPASISLWTRLRCLELSCGGNLNAVTDAPKSLTHLNLSYSGIERISDCIKGINWLQHLNLSGCRKLTSLPELPAQLMFLSADNCESLKTVFSPFYTPNAQLNFTNCLKLRRQAQKAIIQQSFHHGWALLPGSEVPAEFVYRARGNSLTIHRQEENKSIYGFTRFKICIGLSPNYIRDYRVSQLLSRRISKCELYPIDDQIKVYRIPKFQTEHLFVFHSDLVEEDNSSEIVFEFSSKLHDFEIVECGVQICTEETIRDIEGSYESESSKAFDDESENSDRIGGEICDSKEDEKHTNCWSWLIPCFDLSNIVRSIESLVWGRR